MIKTEIEVDGRKIKVFLGPDGLVVMRIYENYHADLCQRFELTKQEAFVMCNALVGASNDITVAHNRATI